MVETPTCTAAASPRDPWAPRAELEAWRAALEALGARVDLRLYPPAGHLFTDPGLPDHDARSAEEAWSLAEEFLAR